MTEQLIVGVFFDRLAGSMWSEGRLMSTTDAVQAGLIGQPRVGRRTDDVMIVAADGPIALVEVKATIRSAAVTPPDFMEAVMLFSGGGSHGFAPIPVCGRVRRRCR